MKEAFIGRQPIFDRKQDVVGYELLYRAGQANAANIVDFDVATSQVIVNAFMEIGLERLVGRHRAFVNVTPQFVADYDTLPFSKEQVVLELPEDTPVAEEVLEVMRKLRGIGFQLVLDNFRYHEKRLPLVELANMVKLDVRVYDGPKLAACAAALRPHDVKLMANRVETHEEFDLCADLDFDYFQGYFLARPKVIKQQKVAPSKLAVLRLLACLQNPDASMDEIEKLISQDLTLSYKLLRHINSAFFSLPKKIESIKRAVTYLGMQTIKRWVRMVALCGVDDQPPELLMTALNRARMCELMAEVAGRKDTDSFFTVGLFSALDAFMGMPMEGVLEKLPLSDELAAALLRNEGPLGEALHCAVSHENGMWDDVGFAGLTPDAISDAYVQAVEWSREASTGLAA